MAGTTRIGGINLVSTISQGSNTALGLARLANGRLAIRWVSEGVFVPDSSTFDILYLGSVDP